MSLVDLNGLTQPITKFIEVTSQGIGKLYEPYHYKKMVDAKAYEMNVIVETLNKSDYSGLFKYSNGLIELETDSTDENSINNILIQRLINKESRKQNNIDNIVSLAYEEIESAKTVSDESVDPDWILRFFETIETISNQDMQILWGKILAGEIKNPNSFSLKTMDLLKNINKHEAKVFNKIANAIIEGEFSYFVIGNDGLLKSLFDISFDDMLTLEDMGVLNRKKIALQILQNNETKTLKYKYCNKLIQHIKEPSPQYEIEIYRITKCGLELSNLVSKNYNELYIRSFVDIIKKNNDTVTSYDYFEDNDHGMIIDNDGIDL